MYEEEGKRTTKSEFSRWSFACNSTIGKSMRQLLTTTNSQMAVKDVSCCCLEGTANNLGNNQL